MEIQKHKELGIAEAEGFLSTIQPSVSATHFIGAEMTSEEFWGIFQYGICPAEVMQSGVSNFAQKLFMIYHWFDHSGRGCFCKQDLIAAILKISEETVRRGNVELKEKDFIEIIFDGRKNTIHCLLKIVGGRTHKNVGAEPTKMTVLTDHSYNKDEKNNIKGPPTPLKRGEYVFALQILDLYAKELPKLYQPKNEKTITDILRKIEARHKEMEWAKGDVDPWRIVFENCKVKNFWTEKPEFKKLGISWLVRPDRRKGKLNLEIMHGGDYGVIIEPTTNKDGTMTEAARGEAWEIKETQERRDKFKYNLARTKEKRIGNHQYWMELMKLSLPKYEELSKKIEEEAQVELDKRIAEGKI